MTAPGWNKMSKKSGRIFRRERKAARLIGVATVLNPLVSSFGREDQAGYTIGSCIAYREVEAGRSSALRPKIQVSGFGFPKPETPDLLTFLLICCRSCCWS